MNEEAENQFEAGKVHAKQAADALCSAAEAKAHEYCGKAEEAYEHACTCARSWQKEGEAYIRENPLRGVLTALGVGFVAGLLFRR